MDPQTSAPASYVDGDEEWEIFSNDGFVYKRRKRQRVAEESSNPPDPELDPAEEERNQRKRKRGILVKVKRKYQKEIDHWEILSNKLSAMQEKSNQFQNPQRERMRNSEEIASVPETSFLVEARDQIEKDGSAQSSLLDELLSMEEAREGIIQNVSNVCEIAEEMFRIEEEEVKESLFNLPVWGSPKDLMASLCYDEI